MKKKSTPRGAFSACQKSQICACQRTRAAEGCGPSPMGISFVSKVAPPKYKGMMMGGWFVATAIGNFLVAIPALMWGASLTVVWGVLTGICLLAAFFVFAILKRLEAVAK